MSNETVRISTLVGITDYHYVTCLSYLEDAISTGNNMEEARPGSLFAFDSPDSEDDGSLVFSDDVEREKNGDRESAKHKEVGKSD